MQTMTMQQAEEQARARRAEAWLALAGMLERERGEVHLDLVEDDRVPRLRRSRRGGRGPLAA